VLLFGSIPVIEHTPGWEIGQGWDKTFEDLPVMWCKNISDLTLETLEEEYPKLMAKRSSFNYHTLTQQYWFDRVLKMATELPEGLLPKGYVRENNKGAEPVDSYALSEISANAGDSTALKSTQTQ
jgi:hypothetical protein